jgi:hypothetical protein
MSMYMTTTMALAIGGLLILSAVYLLYAKRISLNSVATNPSLQGDAMKIEIENIVKVSSNVPALGLFLIGLVIVVAALYYANAESSRNATELTAQFEKVTEDLKDTKALLDKQRQKLQVSGAVAKEDHGSPVDIEVLSNYPIFTPDQDGHLNGLVVERDADGRLPVLVFSQPKYSVQTLDLNLDATVKDNEVIIPPGIVVLKKLVGEGGTK